MGIKHLDQLQPDQFIRILKDFTNCHITEKVDGSNMSFGLDEKGSFYTSREQKGGQKVYDPTDFEKNVNHYQFSYAHKVLHNIEPLIQKHFPPNSCFEVEVLVGRQPNTVIYGNNILVITRILSGDVSIDDVGRFVEEVGTISINQNFPYSSDGKSIAVDSRMSSCQIQLVKSLTLTEKQKVVEVANLEMKLNAFEHWLLSKTIDNYSIRDFININLNTIPLSKREFFKNTRQQLREIAQSKQKDIVMSILTELVYNYTSSYRTSQVFDYEFPYFEGYVISNKDVVSKLVDTTSFTHANKFFHFIRNQLHNTSMSRVQFDGMKIQFNNEPSIYDNLVTRLINLSPSLNNCSKKNIEALINECVKYVDKVRIIAELSITESQIENALILYINGWYYYSTDIFNKKLMYNKHVHSKNMLAFAKLSTLIAKLKKKVECS